MKKVFALLFGLMLMFTSVAVAQDLKAMTNEELIALREAINAELMSRSTAKEMTVPMGTYTIGVDIPAGVYSISTKSMMVIISINDAKGRYLDMYTLTAADTIGKITFSDGEIVEINGVMASVIFTPYEGLGF